jgi:uroporphyrinogen-III decarboxylase
LPEEEDLMPRRSIEEHNAEQKEVWQRLWAGKPVRVPVTLGINIRYYMDNPEVNPRGYSFEQYIRQPDVMAELQLAAAKWARDNVHWHMDAEVGPPEKEWPIYIDYQNCYEAAWFGCEMYFAQGQPPDTRPMLKDDNKNVLFDRGIPDPLNDNAMGDIRRHYERWKARFSTETFEGKPVRCTGLSGLGTDGPMVVAMNLRGGEFLTDLYLEPEWAQQLLRFIVEATIVRIEAWRKHLGPDMPTDWFTQDPMGIKWGMGDDSVEMLSVEAYRELILPHHRQLYEHFGGGPPKTGGGPNFIHLCGDVQRLLPTIRDELKVRSFDTGFPIRWETLRDELGDDVMVWGGVPIALLKDGSPDAVAAETRRILESGIMRGGRFIMREANNLAPGTPLENLRAMYETTKELGQYS